MLEIPMLLIIFILPTVLIGFGIQAHKDMRDCRYRWSEDLYRFGGNMAIGLGVFSFAWPIVAFVFQIRF